MGHCVGMMKSPVSNLPIPRAVLLALLGLLAGGWGPAVAGEGKGAARRPNLVVVVDDQHSADMLGCYGNPDVQTPRLDAFARAGDHGDMLRSYGWAGNKGRAESSSCRVPLLMSWPGQLAPGTSELLVGTLDLMPTLLGLLGLPVPETCQGRNAAEAIRAGRDDGVDALPLFYLPLNWRGVYTRRHTYSVALHDPDEAGVPGGRKTFDVLYDRQADPAETRNLFDAPDAADLRAKLHAQTLEMMRRFADGGLRSSEIIRRVMTDEDLAVVQMPLARRHEGWNGRLKGRPIDLLPALP